ncbi:hypothetical protein C823_005219 [Eubacterium plexicaudatum ASF492]|nr:hypothetical protein C823_005219 [Eubacterium plexicaudatum ASF492]
MRVTNISRKIISIFGKTLLPGEDVKLDNVDESNPTIQFYLKAKVLAVGNTSAAQMKISDTGETEREKIAREAVEKYKQEQEEYRKKAEEKENEIKAVKGMKKKRILSKKQSGLGLNFQIPILPIC